MAVPRHDLRMPHYAGVAHADCEQQSARRRRVLGPRHSHDVLRKAHSGQGSLGVTDILGGRPMLDLAVRASDIRRGEAPTAVRGRLGDQPCASTDRKSRSRGPDRRNGR
jgi:hypothetical protein